MLSKEQIQEIFHPRRTVESRIKSTILDLFDQRVSARFEPYKWDFNGYVETFLNGQPWDKQSEIADSYILALRQQHEKRDYEAGLIPMDDLEFWRPGQIIQNWIGIDAGHTVGKCVAASEYITLSSGERVIAEKLIDRKFYIPTIDKVSGQVIFALAAAEFNAIEPVFKITTQSGKQIVRSANHPLWVSSIGFQSGRRPQVLDFDWRQISKVEPGQFVAVTEKLPVWGNDATFDDNELKLLGYLIGDGGYTQHTVVFSQQKNKQLDELIVCAAQLGCTVKYASQYDYRIVGPGKGKKNPVIELLRNVGLMGCHSRDKFIPSEIFEQPKEKIQLFLSRLFSTDGWVSVTKDGKQKEIGFCSASETLIRDIQDLLIRFGVHGNIFKKNGVNAWVLSIKSSPEIIRFCENIRIYGKEDAQAKVFQLAKVTHDKTLTNWKKRPDRPPWRYKECVPNTRWEKVVSVEYVGIEPTVAIEVPGFETYLTSFYEHNTYLLAKIVSHFFDCFTPSIVYCFAPSSEQINDLLFKEIRVDRRDRDLPGVVLPRTPRINYGDNHFVTGKATNNSTGTGTERTHGQHGEYLLFVVDEAEGIPEFIWQAIRSMTSGGINMVIFARNPRTTTCDAHEIRSRTKTKAYTISCLDTPNVRENREVVPNLVMRDYVLEMLDANAEQVREHNPDHYTFELPWDPGTIYRPQPEFSYRVLGIAPENITVNTFCPYGRYDAAVKRGKENQRVFTSEHEKATIGVDAARFGDDFGTVWILRGDWLWRSGNFQTSDSFTFYNHIIEQMKMLVEDGVVQIEIRVDAGGGWGAGTIDLFKYNAELQYRSPEDREELLALMPYASTREQRDYLAQALAATNGDRQNNPWASLIDFEVFEVNFDGTPDKGRDFYNLVTEMYYHLGEAMNRLRLEDAPKTLREDLCARTYDYGMRDGYSVKVLSPKKKFKKVFGRSSDDGDGAGLAVAPSHIFKMKPIILSAG